MALEHFLLYHPDVNICHACTDNDNAGEMAAAKILALPHDDKRFSHVGTARDAPPFGKDWNDAIMEIKRRERNRCINIPESRGNQDKGDHINMKALQSMVGGEIDLAPLNKRAVIVWGITGGGIKDKSGAFAVCGLNDDGKLTSLHPYWAQQYKREFTPREPEEKMPFIKEQLANAQKAAADFNSAAKDKPVKARKQDGMDV